MDSFGLDTFASRAIYKDLIAGKIINEIDYIGGELQPSNKFIQLRDNLDTYRQLYSLQGFNIESINAQAFFVTRDDRTEDYNELAANMQTLLVVIARGLYTKGTNPSILTSDTGGISSKDIDEIGEFEEEGRILNACGLQVPLTRSVNGILVERGIMHKTNQERYILSSSGKHLFDEVFNDTKDSG